MEMDAILLEVAKQHLRIDSFSVRNRDCLDFRDIHIASIQKALEAAFAAGRAEALAKSYGL